MECRRGDVSLRLSATPQGSLKAVCVADGTPARDRLDKG